MILDSSVKRSLLSSTLDGAEPEGREGAERATLKSQVLLPHEVTGLWRVSLALSH